MRINKVEICGVDTSKLKTLSEKRKKELLRLAKEGDKEAREELILGNLRLVLSIIQRFNTKGDSANDLFQVGCIGLIKSIDNFNLEFDVKFSTYAVSMIIGEIRRYLRDYNAIRVSRSVKDTEYKALTAKEELIKETGREPTIAEIAKLLGKDPNSIRIKK